MKKKIIYICVLFLIIAPFLYAQHAVGSWQNYLSYHNVTRTEPAGNIIYSLMIKKIPVSSAIGKIIF